MRSNAAFRSGLDIKCSNDCAANEDLGVSGAVEAQVVLT